MVWCKSVASRDIVGARVHLAMRAVRIAVWIRITVRINKKHNPPN